MPIATRKPTVDKPIVPNTPVIQPESYQSVVVDEKKVQLNTLVAYVEGAPWTVNYYQQVVSKNNDLKDLDPGQSAIYQQYSKINNLEIRVTTPLNSSQDNDNALVSVTGSANIYPFITPNVGDIFIASVLEGRQGILRVTNVERRTFDRNSIFAIEYDLVSFVDSDQERFGDLEAKVIRQFFFDKDRLTEGLNPTLVATEYREQKDLTTVYTRLVDYYFKTFYNREFSTLILPGQSVSIYDGFLVDYVMRIVDTFDAENIRYVKQLGCELDTYMQQDQFWTVMMQREHSGLGFANPSMGLVTTSQFDFKPDSAVLRYSRLDHVLYPVIPDTTVNSGRFSEPVKTLSLSSIVSASPEVGSISSLLFNQYIEQNVTTSIIKPVLVDEYYVLSKDFYEDKSGQSLLEMLVTDYLKGKAINAAKLLKITDTYRRWGRLEQFYYIPILLTLIKATRQGLY